MKKKKHSYMLISFLCFPILAIIFSKIAPLHSNKSFIYTYFIKQEDCKPLREELFELVQSQIDSPYHHGYRRISKCGQTLYVDYIAHTQQPLFSRSAEKYSEMVKKDKGSGYIDFQYPDIVSKNVDHGYVVFPSDSTCEQ